MTALFEGQAVMKLLGLLYRPRLWRRPWWLGWMLCGLLLSQARAVVWQRLMSWVVKPLMPHWFLSSSKPFSHPARRLLGVHTAV